MLTIYDEDIKNATISMDLSDVATGALNSVVAQVDNQSQKCEHYLRGRAFGSKRNGRETRIHIHNFFEA